MWEICGFPKIGVLLGVHRRRIMVYGGYLRVALKTEIAMSRIKPQFEVLTQG